MPYDVASAKAASGTSLVLTVGTGSVGTPGPSAAGDFLWIAASAVTSATTASVSDPSGNTWTQVVGTGGAALGGSNNQQYLFVSKTTVALGGGAQVTLNFGTSSGAKQAICRGQSGVLSATPDKQATNTGTSGTASSGSSGTLGQQNELVIGVFVNASGGGAPASPSFGTLETLGQNNYLSVIDELVSSTAAVTASATITSVLFSASVTTFRLLVSGTASQAVTPVQHAADTDIRTDAGAASETVAPAQSAGAVELEASAASQAVAPAQAAGAVLVTGAPYLIGSQGEPHGMSSVPVAVGSNGGHAPAPGDALVVGGCASSVAVSGVTDSDGSADTYGTAPGASNASVPGTWVYTCASPGALLGGRGSFTVGFSGGGGAKGAIAVGVPQVSGLDTPVNAAGSGTAVSVATGTLAVPGEVLVAFCTCGQGGGSGFTWGAGWTQICAPFETQPGNEWMTAAYKVASGTSPVTATATLGGTSAWTIVVQPLIPLTAAAAQAVTPGQAAVAGVTGGVRKAAASQAVTPAQAAGATVIAIDQGTAAQQVTPGQSAAAQVTGPGQFPDSALDVGVDILLPATGTPILFGTNSVTWASMISAGVTGLSTAIGYANVGEGPGTPQGFTANHNATACTFTVTSGTAPAVGVPVALSGGSLPGGFSASVNIYYVVTSSGAAFQLSQVPATNGGTAQGSTSAGSGTVTPWTGVPAAWPGTGAGLPYPGGVAHQVLNFKPTPQLVVTGALDSALTAFFASAPAGSWAMPWHECNKDGPINGFTAAQLVAADQRMIALAHAANPSMLYGRGFSSGPGTPDPAPFITPGMDFYGMDGYQHSDPTRTPDSLFDGLLSLIRGVQPGAKVAVIETNTHIVGGIPAWFGAVQSWALENGLFAVQSFFGTNQSEGPGGQTWDSSFAGEMNTMSAALAAAGASEQWQSISGYIWQPSAAGTAVTITGGRTSESATASPAAAAMQADNRTGTFTASDPAGQWYGLIGRNTPVRVSVPSAQPCLRLEDDSASCASCPDAAGLDITASIDIRVDLTLSDYQGGVLAAKWTPGAGATDNSWVLALNNDGTVTLFWSSTGSNLLEAQSTAPIPLGRVMIRATLAHSTGVVTFYTAAEMGGAMAQLGQPVDGGGGATSIYASTAAVGVGNYGPPGNADGAGVHGQIFEFRLYNGIGGAGTLAADPVFSAQPPGSGSFTDAQGNPWTMNGTAEISQRLYHYHGEMASAPKATDPTLTNVYTPLACAGILQRLQQANAPLYSPMRRAAGALAGVYAPHAYWPGEDLAGSRVLGSAAGGPSMTVSGGTGDGSLTTSGADMAADSSFACSLPLAEFAGSVWAGQVPAYDSNGSLIVRFLLNVQDTPASGARIMRVFTSGTLGEWSLYYSTGGGLGIAGYDAAGTVFDSGVWAFAADQPMWVSMELRPGTSGQVNWSLATLVPGAAAGNGISGSFAGTIGNALVLYPNPQGALNQVTCGHLTVQSAWQSLFALYQPLNAWNGETAGSRFARLCGENGISARVYGIPANTAAMGTQPAGTLSDLLQQCEAADQGQIFEPASSYGLGYRTLASLCNQPPAAVIDFSKGWVDDQGFAPPTDDDTYTVNDVTATRASGGSGPGASGASVRVFLDDGSRMSVTPPPQGAGDYASSIDASVQSDAQVPGLASWAVHAGSVDEGRYPAIPVDLSWRDIEPARVALQEVQAGDYLQVINPPSWMSTDDIRQLAAGYTIELGNFTYRIAWNGIPERPYETGIHDDPVYGKANTSGSALAAGVNKTATALSVATAAGNRLWTTRAADFPFDISLKPATAPGRGERVTVTAISGASSPQAFTVVRSVNGVVMSHAVGEAVTLFYAPVYAAR